MTVDLYRAIERRNWWKSLGCSILHASLYIVYAAGLVYAIVNWPAP